MTVAETVAGSSGEVSTGKSLRAYHTPSMEHMAHITLYLVFFRVLKEMCVWRPPAEVTSFRAAAASLRVQCASTYLRSLDL